MVPVWEAWQSLQRISIPQEYAMGAEVTSGVTVLERPVQSGGVSVKEVLAELKRIAQERAKAKAEASEAGEQERA